jgi:hypothetical protein
VEAFTVSGGSDRPISIDVIDQMWRKRSTTPIGRRLAADPTESAIQVFTPLVPRYFYHNRSALF